MQVNNITADLFPVNTGDDHKSVVRTLNERFRVVALVEMRNHDKRGLLITMLDEGISFHEVMPCNWDSGPLLIFCAVRDFGRRHHTT